MESESPGEKLFIASRGVRRQDAAEMPDFVVHLGWVSDGFSDLVPKEAAVTLPEPMDQPFHGRIVNAQRFGERRIRDIFALGSEAGAQRLEGAQFSLALTFFAETPQRLFDHGGGPPQIKEAFRRPRVQGLRGNRELRWRLRHPVIPGNEIDVAAAFARVPFFGGVIQEIAERLEQERTESAPRRISVPEPVILENHDEEILGKILRVLRGMTAPADKGKDRPPIEPAKLGQRLARLLIVAAEIG